MASHKWGLAEQLGLEVAYQKFQVRADYEDFDVLVEPPQCDCPDGQHRCSVVRSGNLKDFACVDGAGRTF